MIPNITVIIPNRNRNLKTVSRTLDSIKPQLSEHLKIYVVDYGSELNYQSDLKHLVMTYGSIELIECPTQGQLFHKTRAINLVLKQTLSKYFMVLDMDCICHPNFFQIALRLAENGDVVNFPYGYLSEKESLKDQKFQDYEVRFPNNITGTAIFETKKLLEINGFDEVFHNWGAEDADAFARLKRAGTNTNLYHEKLLLLHQWHSKTYRQKQSKAPFHNKLEKINHKYFELSNKLKRIRTNESLNWGIPFNLKHYSLLKTPDFKININSSQEEIVALISQLNEFDSSSIVEVIVTSLSTTLKVKVKIKSLLGKRQLTYISLEKANELLLENIILRNRNKPYHYQFDRSQDKIIFRINLINPT
ncbi:glycosyltransferase family 2 protein [Nonlabens antarcticus]|uniref:glycosyltransferase family 2 protein n=1 Tax=Nonlabens antarcticus TaxID=392714 RepID=UPI0018915F97|nr:glycosyltransferase [Nonlabens antarcticus]